MRATTLLAVNVCGKTRRGAAAEFIGIPVLTIATSAACSAATMVPTYVLEGVTGRDVRSSLGRWSDDVQAVTALHLDTRPGTWPGPGGMRGALTIR